MLRSKPRIPRIYTEERYGKTSYRVYYQLLGRKKTRRFKTAEDAERFRDYLNSSIPTAPTEWEYDISEKELSAIVKMIMRQKNVTNIDDVYACLTNNLTPNIVSFKTVTEAALEFAEVKRLEGRRANLITQYEQVLSGLIKQLGKKTPKLSDCNQTTIEAYLKTKKIGGKKHAYVMLKSFFRWCISRKYMQLSPIDDVVLPKKVQKDNYNASVLHPLALNILLELTRPNLYIHITYLLLSMTGLRPQELLPTTKDTKDTLRWNDIQPQTKAIRIRRDISKTHSASTIIGTPQRLWGTLCEIPMQKYQSSDRIGINYYYYKKLTRHLNALLSLAYDLFIKKGGVLLPTQSFLITRDILRHSFASYAIHTIGIPATALITRHSLAIMQSHYLGVATKEDAELYFNGCEVTEYINYLKKQTDIALPTHKNYKHRYRPIMKRLLCH